MKKWSRDEMASRVARDIPDGDYVNLGIGLPTPVAHHFAANRDTFLHRANGRRAMGPPPRGGALRVVARPPPGARRALPRFVRSPRLQVTWLHGVLMGWHWPALYDATLLNPNLHVLEHLMFMGTAVLIWWPILGPARDGEGISPLMMLGHLAFAGVPATVFGIAFAQAATLLDTL